jgi:DNA-binding transcriptional MerR regulator
VAEQEDLTIEQLVAEVGLPYTTIRMYQNRGLLSPPERRGRVGYYGSDHLARLRLIAQLQERGYSLAAIKDLVETWQTGRSLPDVLGVERSAAGVLGASAVLRLRPDELAERFAGIDLTPEAMARAYELGLVSFDGDVVVIPLPVFLEVGSELVRMGVPVMEVLDEYEHLRQVSDELAERFAAVFERNIWGPFIDDGMPPEQVPHLTESLERLSPLAEAIVTATLHQALAEVAARFLDRQAKALSEKPPARTRAEKAAKR